ncbi:MAG: type II toxin-antitoxin system prevent-host-death family antitoxin [Alphaproteobacteria bacterium]|nr:type II toxin-antitoxin system prevent-host-death family antitoxin [Alphaproteobacteria bacterium]
MTETVVNIYDAKAKLSQLVERAMAGDAIVIAKAGRPMVRLVPCRDSGARRVPGGADVLINEDFDAPLDDGFERAMKGMAR